MSSIEQVTCVKTADFYLEKKNPPNYVITATGEVPTLGWKNGTLSIIQHVTPPADGMQELAFNAEKPGEIVGKKISEIKATLTLHDVDQANYWGPGIHLTGFHIVAKINSFDFTLGANLTENMVEIMAVDTFEGTSQKGDFSEALSKAVGTAHEVRGSTLINWKIENISGVSGGITGATELTVEISADN